MYAIIKSGGKQYRVAKDDVIDVELLHVDQGSAVEFSEVLFVNDGTEALIGEPVVAGYLVKGEVVGTSAGPKVSSLKYRPRGHTQKHWGHRQHYTRVKITDIASSGKVEEKKAAPKKAVPKKKKEEDK
ncbi:50S ribosomal protein L21 [Waddlia chondrophila 2032/99]|uniref:Large ribosomal subunit protein bL21 n=2 Tax=Waddlia chondrophila TaxID=71667 RepID=D6YSF1_WADCW|nr:50S ribosomal protein L21 [Waddlia chondrophila]ADI38996.1 50S ribosomal protein L21 [Waddlia chondrophila WSU 86-1044]CCB92117.1 50S ribosomal protein L21 [Waddlia chondrophila 2032/99]